MKGRIDNKMGSIQIDPEVIAMYAGTTAVECFGIEPIRSEEHTSELQSQ